MLVFHSFFFFSLFFFFFFFFINHLWHGPMVPSSVVQVQMQVRLSAFLGWIVRSGLVPVLYQAKGLLLLAVCCLACIHPCT